jgi:hypothetical protein
MTSVSVPSCELLVAARRRKVALQRNADLSRLRFGTREACACAAARPIISHHSFDGPHKNSGRQTVERVRVNRCSSGPISGRRRGRNLTLQWQTSAVRGAVHRPTRKQSRESNTMDVEILAAGCGVGGNARLRHDGRPTDCLVTTCGIAADGGG